MKTSDYRGILFNFWNDYWTENRDIIPAICYAIDRQAIVDAVLLGQGMPAYGPLQRNVYNNENVEHYDYNPEKAKQLLEDAGCVRGASGTTSAAARRSRSRSASCPASRIARHRTGRCSSSCARSASTALWTSRPSWTGAARWRA